MLHPPTIRSLTRFASPLASLTLPPLFALSSRSFFVRGAAVAEEDVRETLALRKFYVLDTPDAEGRPVIYVNFESFIKTKYVVEDEIQAYLYMLENVVLPRMAEAGAPKWTSMIDVSLIESIFMPYT